MNREFECRQCGACCRAVGDVRLLPEDIEVLATHLGLSLYEFTEKYTRLTADRAGLVLAGDAKAPCLFLDESNRCRVHEAKPWQCRVYPERWRSAEIAAVCPAQGGSEERSKEDQ